MCMNNLELDSLSTDNWFSTKLSYQTTCYHISEESNRVPLMCAVADVQEIF